MEQSEILAYLDHNVLDLMIKGDPFKVKELLIENKLTPVYSDESLKEIHRSKGYENKFLDLLEDIGAKYIKPVLNQSFKQTGQARIYMVSPKASYEQFLKNQDENSNGDFGLTEMLMKFYGGKQDSSFEEIFENGANELQRYLLETINEIDDIPEANLLDISRLKTFVAELPEMMKGQASIMAADLDKQNISPVTALEAEMGIGPIVLKNVAPPNVVLKIWGIVSEKNNLPDIDLETFFGVKPHSFEVDSDRERTLQEKVNAIYHQLNFLGYYRDSNMKKERRFKASFSDMTHAGIASFCHVFLCGDEDLVMKAAAAFEYLGAGTKILHYKANKLAQPTVNASAD
ncbi:MAG: hypothetical protein ACXV8P_05005 [Methylobacter sp.]